MKKHQRPYYLFSKIAAPKAIGLLITSFFIGSWALAQTSSTAHHTTSPRSIKITTEYLFPLNMIENGSSMVYGQSADKVHELFKRGKIAYEIKIMSWNRAIELAKQNQDTCVFSTAKIKEREDWFHWIGPIATGNWSIFGHPSKLGKVNRLEEIKQETIGTEVGNVSVAYLAERGHQVVTSNESTTTFKNLALGRIDYAAAGDSHGAKIIADNQLQDKVVKLFNFNSSDYYLACNKHMDTATISLLNSKLKEMKTDGSFKAIDAKY